MTSTIPVLFSTSRTRVHAGRVDRLCVVQPAEPRADPRVFDAHLAIVEHKNIICAGFQCVLHLHTLVEEVTIQVRPRRH